MIITSPKRIESVGQWKIKTLTTLSMYFAIVEEDSTFLMGHFLFWQSKELEELENSSNFSLSLSLSLFVSVFLSVSMVFSNRLTSLSPSLPGIHK